MPQLFYITESQDILKSIPSSPIKSSSSFSVRSDSHPSLKMKAAAKAKSRASQDQEDAVSAVAAAGDDIFEVSCDRV